MTAAGGLRKRRTRFFVSVDRDTVRNDEMSYRALGLLTYLLDLPEGWDVKSEVLAQGGGREGREAVRTALRELAQHGHYRIERRQARDGRFSMGTAISEDPVPEWIADFHEYEGKPVVVVQQADGTYQVLHKDGTTSPDGFPAPDHETAGLPLAQAEPTSIAAGQTEDGFPGFGFPGPGFPDAGSPEDGSLGVTREREKGEREGRHNVTSTSARDVKLPVDNSRDQRPADTVKGSRPATPATDQATAEETLTTIDEDEVERTLQHLPDRLRPTRRDALRLRGLIVQRMQRGWSREAILEAVAMRLRDGGTLDNPCGLFAAVLVPLHESPTANRSVEAHDQPSRTYRPTPAPWCGKCDKLTRRPLDFLGFPDATQPHCTDCKQLAFEEHMQRGAS
jgi:hypothetical protein